MLDDDLREPMVRTLDEMTVMADELVAYARGDQSAEERERVALGDLLTSLCADRGATLEIGANAEVIARPVALIRAIGNLVDNAVRYGGVGAGSPCRGRGARRSSPSRMTAPASRPSACATCSNPSCGARRAAMSTPAAQGLACPSPGRSCAPMGATIDLQNRDAGGLRATVRLPLS